MFSKIFSKFNTFGEQHQVILAVIIGMIIVCMSWALEEILDKHIFHSKSLRSYLITITIGLLMLWIIKHFILHVW